MPERPRLTAQVVATYPDGAEEIRVGSHRIQFGYGNGGDGYCYAHQSFDCVDRLSIDERSAVREAL